MLNHLLNAHSLFLKHALDKNFVKLTSIRQNVMRKFDVVQTMDFFFLKKIQCLATRTGSCDGWLDFPQTVTPIRVHICVHVCIHYLYEKYVFVKV